MFEKAKELGEVSEVCRIALSKRKMPREFEIIMTLLREHTCMLAISVL